MLVNWIREAVAAVVAVLALVVVLAAAVAATPILGLMLLLLKLWPGSETAVSRCGLSAVRRLTHRLRLASIERAAEEAVGTASGRTASKPLPAPEAEAPVGGAPSPQLLQGRALALAGADQIRKALKDGDWSPEVRAAAERVLAGVETVAASVPPASGPADRADRVRMRRFAVDFVTKALREHLPKAGAAILAGLLLMSCGVKVPPVVTPGYEQLAHQLDTAKAAVETVCAAGESDACARARALVAELQGLLDRFYPDGPPTTEPASPPVTQPPSTPPTTIPEEPQTPPPAEGCVLAGEPSTALPQHRSTLGSIVNAVMLDLKPECGYAGGTCLLGEETQQHWQARVEAGLRARGICAGQHEPWTDEIAAARVATDPWEGYRIFSGDDTEGPLPPGAPRRTVQWAPPDGSLERPDGKGGYRAAWVPPAAQPTPAPTATPAAGSCPAPRWESYRNPATKQDCTLSWGYGAHPAKWRDKDGGLVQGLDATLTVTRCCGFCEAIGMGEFNGQMRCSCPLRPEGSPERELCEAEVGAVWGVQAGTLVPNPGNRAQAGCEGAGCQIRVCAEVEPRACGEWRQP